MAARIGTEELDALHRQVAVVRRYWCCLLLVALITMVSKPPCCTLEVLVELPCPDALELEYQGIDQLPPPR